jgi:hypothetical protein
VDSSPVLITPSLRAELRATYADDVARLGALLGRDLSHWFAEQLDPAQAGGHGR